MEQWGGIHVWIGPLLLPLLDPIKMGPGLDQFILLYLKWGQRAQGWLASCFCHQSSIFTSLKG